MVDSVSSYWECHLFFCSSVVSFRLSLLILLLLIIINIVQCWRLTVDGWLLMADCWANNRVLHFQIACLLWIRSIACRHFWPNTRLISSPLLAFVHLTSSNIGQRWAAFTAQCTHLSLMNTQTNRPTNPSSRLVSTTSCQPNRHLNYLSLSLDSIHLL